MKPQRRIGRIEQQSEDEASCLPLNLFAKLLGPSGKLLHHISRFISIYLSAHDALLGMLIDAVAGFQWQECVEMLVLFRDKRDGIIL